MISYFSLVIQVITLIVSLVMLKKYNTIFLMLLTILCFSTVVVEVIGDYHVKNGTSNFIYYYVFTLVECSLITLMYINLATDNKTIKIHKLFFLFFLISWLIVWINRDFFRYCLLVESIVIGVYVLLFLRNLLLSDKILSYKKSLSFWISIGFMVFYLPSIPFFIILEYMQNRKLFFVLDVLTILMGLLIIYGLLCSKKKERY
nr:hypothetical protein BACY1_07310 [Tenacibaculum mesophilum]